MTERTAKLGLQINIYRVIRYGLLLCLFVVVIVLLSRNRESKVPFETVSMDFIFALPGQTFEDLKTDIDTAFLSGANHVAIYPFIDFTFTDSTVSAMPGKAER